MNALSIERSRAQIRHDNQCVKNNEIWFGEWRNCLGSMITMSNQK